MTHKSSCCSCVKSKPLCSNTIKILLTKQPTKVRYHQNWACQARKCQESWDKVNFLSPVVV